jgi:hypothetical protein
MSLPTFILSWGAGKTLSGLSNDSEGCLNANRATVIVQLY